MECGSMASNLVERQSPIDKLYRTARRQAVPSIRFQRQHGQLHGVSRQAGVVKSRPADVAVRETLSLAPRSPHPEHCHLLVAHTFWRLHSVNPYVPKVRGENLATLGESLSGDDEHQNAGGLQPAISVT